LQAKDLRTKNFYFPRFFSSFGLLPQGTAGLTAKGAKSAKGGLGEPSFVPKNRDYGGQAAKRHGLQRRPALRVCDFFARFFWTRAL